MGIAQKNLVKLTNNLLLFNGDCTFLFGESYQITSKVRYSIDTIHGFIGMLAESGVDIYLQNPNAQKPWYPSKTLPSILSGYRRGDREAIRGHFPPPNDTNFTVNDLNRSLDACVALLNRHLDLLEDGIDWLEEVATACRNNKIKPWLTVRMNDAHGSENWENSFFNCELQRDPRYRLSGREPGRAQPDPWQQLLDYGHREVRDYYFAMIRELVEDYDYEGLELDWLRDPFCCEPQASQDSLDMMTEWIAQIRELTRRKAERTGRPYPLGMRIPARLGALKAIGLDVAAFAREGLIDFIAPGNYLQTSWELPYDDLRKAAGEKVAIYGVIDNVPNWIDCSFSQEISEIVEKTETFTPTHRCLSASEAMLRGNAAGKLVQGANGIYTFNFFCTDEPNHNYQLPKLQAKYPALKQLSNLDALRGQPKHYTLASGSDYRMRRPFETADQLPLTLDAGDQHTIVVPMCAEPGKDKDLLVQIVVAKGENAPSLDLRFNGYFPLEKPELTGKTLFPTGIFTHHSPDNEAWNFRFEARAIGDGCNEIFIMNGHGGPVRIRSIEMAV